MQPKQINRRDLNRLAMAAFGGVFAAGLATSCQGSSNGEDESKSGGGESETHVMLTEPHVCRGLNTCKGMGAGKSNECAGLGTCATAEAHTCHAANDCKGSGGCGTTAGINECKGTGECGVPLNDKTWKRARATYEAAMNSAGKSFGDAPQKS